MVDFKNLSERITKAEDNYRKLLFDAGASAKLNEWEVGFIQSLQTMRMSEIVTRYSELSVKQQTSLNRIEEKIYAVG